VIAQPPNLVAVASSWTLSPVTDLLVLAGTAGYFWLAFGPRSGDPPRWPPRRTSSWCAAMVVLLIAVGSPLASYAEVLFWVHMVQHLLLIMLVPVLLVWAQPVALFGSARGNRAAGPPGRAIVGGLARWAGWPPAGLAIYTAVVVLAHLTGFQQLSLAHGWIRDIELTVFLLSGWLYFAPLVGGGRTSGALPFLFRFVLLAAGMGADTLAGVVLMLTGKPLAPGYATAHPGWGPSALADQELAGAIMWFGGDLLMMLLVIMVAVLWSRAGDDRQGFGEWLEGARRRALAGEEPDFDFGPGSADSDIDEDQRALDAYNARLAALHLRSGPSWTGPEQGGSPGDERGEP
jgi:putative copper resistance protein D